MPESKAAIPRHVTRFLAEAERRMAACNELCRLPGFVPSDYVAVYRALTQIAALQIAPGKSFCEWGSGFGVIACLASLAGFESCGIEIEPVLVEAALRLASDFDIRVQFHCDSFLPSNSYPLIDSEEPSLYLVTRTGIFEEQGGIEPGDFDLIFAYPGPDDDRVIARVFGRYANIGATILTYHGREGIRLRRKMNRRTRHR